jgi:hypothetical protein
MRDVPEGKYLVCVEPFQWRQEVDVNSASAAPAFDLGEPCEVVVSILDDATNSPAKDAEVTWHTLLPGQASWSPATSERRAADGAFVLRAPRGTVHVDAKATGLVPVETTAEAAVGASTQLTIRLKRGATLVVNLEFDGKPYVDGRPFVNVTRTADDGGSTTLGRGAEQGVVTFDGEAPGACTVALREVDFPGWTCEPQDVALKAGETTTVVLKLARKP